MLKGQNRLDAIAHLHLFEKLRYIMFDGTHLKIELPCDLFVGQSLRDKREQLLFPLTERCRGLPRWRPRARPTPCFSPRIKSQLRADKCLARVDQPNDRGKL